MEMQNLLQHQQEISPRNIIDLFSADKKRFEKFSLEAAGLFLDYSKNKITSETLTLLLALANKANLRNKIEDMFSGKPINITENRAVLHTALRDPKNKAHPEIQQVLQQMEHCVNAIRNGNWRGFSKQKITAIVNIGIGGSDLGPAMATKALTPYSSMERESYFVSNVDSTNIAETLKKLNPETTLFIVASKTFTTQETLCNAVTAKEWLLSQAKSETAIEKHFIAVTAKPERAKEFGILKENIFPFWDWVGGRFSMWGAIGLAIAIAIGMDNFKELLAGAHAMDEHFRKSEFKQNMPVILALLGIWNTNFFNIKTQAIIPYDQYLELLPAYLQQLEMESNGKSVSLDGKKLTYATAPVIWGAVGTNGQHAFHQLLLQGTQIIPVDFIIAANTHNPIGDHHLLLMANCLAQSQALMRGKNREEVFAELIKQGLTDDEAKKLTPHKIIPGNVPNNTIMMQQLTPATLGALLALYEHKVFVQGVIWNINSFDQWGVELGKQIANSIIPNLADQNKPLNFDSSTNGLIKKYFALKN